MFYIWITPCNQFYLHNELFADGCSFDFSHFIIIIIIICLFIFLFIYLFIYLFVCLFIYLLFFVRVYFDFHFV